MSVVRIPKPEGKPESGGGMDRVVEKKGLPRQVKIGLAAAGVLLLILLFWFYAPSSNSQTVEASRLTISTVERGRFDDFLPLRARVEPLVTVYLDAVEGGRVERVLVEDGAMVQQGQLLAVLSNSDLQLNVLARQTEVTQQINSMRSQELALSQTRLANERAVIEAQLAVATARRNYELQRPLAERGFVSQRQFQDSRDAYEAARDRLAVLRRTQATDERLQSSQLAQLRASTAALNQSLELARLSLDALNLRAPVAGQLTAFSIQVGQSFNRGERLGQIDSAGRNKLRAQVDEFYLGRVAEGQFASAEIGGRQHRMRVSKIYPQVRNGAFEIDLQFVGQEPADLQRGQTVQIRLTLGDPAPALLIPNGAFYNETGGNWVFVVAPDGRSAVRRQVRLGRRNADHIEVLEGLDPGERVITSPYTGFAERDRLSMRDVSRVYRTDTVETTALDGIYLDVDDGEFVAVMGPSGCGKSTLLNVVGMLDSPTSGSYMFNGTEVAGLSESKLADFRKRNIGFIFQSFNLVDELSVRENIELALLYHNVPAAERRTRVDAVMDRVGIAHRARHRPSQLSGGQQQRVAVARALVASPKLILADEPTGNLDTAHGEEVMKMLQALNAEGSTIVMVTHSPAHADYAGRVVNMLDGRILIEHRRAA